MDLSSSGQTGNNGVYEWVLDQGSWVTSWSNVYARKLIEREKKLIGSLI